MRVFDITMLVCLQFILLIALTQSGALKGNAYCQDVAARSIVALLDPCQQTADRPELANRTVSFAQR